MMALPVKDLWCPGELLLRRRGLSDTDFWILLLAVNHGTETEGALLPEAALAERARVTVRTVRGRLRKLESAGLIRSTGEGDLRRVHLVGIQYAPEAQP